MEEFSYSRVSTFNDCPFKYKLQYIDKLKTKFDEDPCNALVQGTAIHESIETGNIEAALDNYTNNYADKSQLAIQFENFKLKGAMQIAIEECPKGTVYEYELKCDGEFVGYIDCLVDNHDGTYDIFDYKYTNNVDSYLGSPQVHLYKYYFEKLTGKSVRNISYVFIPKCGVKYDDNVQIDDQLNQVIDFMNKAHVRIESVEYDPDVVEVFRTKILRIKNNTVFEHRQSWKCKWCQYKKFCQSNGMDRSELKGTVIQESLF